MINTALVFATQPHQCLVLAIYFLSLTEEFLLIFMYIL